MTELRDPQTVINELTDQLVDAIVLMDDTQIAEMMKRQGITDEDVDKTFERIEKRLRESLEKKQREVIQNA